jgi:transcriptional regulator with XRE-family HTH domain
MMVVTTRTQLAAVVKARRLELGMSQADLARACGVRRQWVSGLESGTVNPTADNLLRCFSALGLAMSLEPLDTSLARSKLQRVIAAATG